MFASAGYCGEVGTRRKQKNIFSYKNNQPWVENATVVMQLGLTMVGCIVFCFVIGHAIDNRIGTRGIFATLFILFGVIGGGVVVYRQIFEIIGENDSSEESDNGIPKTD